MQVQRQFAAVIVSVDLAREEAVIADPRRVRIIIVVNPARLRQLLHCQIRVVFVLKLGIVDPGCWDRMRGHFEAIAIADDLIPLIGSKVPLKTVNN